MNKTEIFPSYSAFLARANKKTNGVGEIFVADYPSYENQNGANEGCWNCRGGWVVTMAGEKGRAMELASSTLFAAMQIYKASSPIRVSPVRFFETNAVAMADMERCAAEEAALNPAP